MLHNSLRNECVVTHLPCRLYRQFCTGYV